MRASEFIFEVSNPSGPPPRMGTPEFTKSKNTFDGIVARVLKNFNDELTFLARTNPTEFNNRTTDTEGLLQELQKQIIEEIIKSGNVNFVKTDIAKLNRAFKLNDTNTTMNPTTKIITINNNIRDQLTNTATSTWYENRYVRFNNQPLWAKLSGGVSASDKPKSGVPVQKLEASAANNFQITLGVDVDEPTFWKYLKDALNNDRKRKNIHTFLKGVYPTTSTIVSGSETVKTLDAAAAREMEALLGVKVASDVFWPNFTDGIDDSTSPATTLTKIQDIFNRHY